MKERIILAPAASETELLRSLAKAGVNSMGWHVMNGPQLAKTALMRSGIAVEETFLTGQEEPALLFSFLHEIPYFEAASFADAEALSSALWILRSLITEDEENTLRNKLAGGEFPEKNAALLSVYDKYTSLLRSSNKIDTVGLLRKALDTAAPFDADFVMLKEFPLTPLETSLLSFVSEGDYTELSLAELFGAEERAVSIADYTEGYGTINEVLHILTEIYDQKIPLDACTIACTNPGKYGQIFFDLSRQYGIPATYGCGVPITNTNPAELLKLLYHWDIFGQHGIDPLQAILRSDAFDRKAFFSLLGQEENADKNTLPAIVEMAGNLRISFDKGENENRITAFRKVLQENGDETSLNILKQVEVLSHALEEGYASFIDRFSLIRPEPLGRFDKSAVKVITDFLNAYLEYGDAATVGAIIPKLLEKTVSSEISREGALHITSMEGALTALRKNLYVCGLSASEFPGSPTENYLLLDSDLLLFGDTDQAPTSEQKIRLKKDTFRNLLQTASALGSRISLSWSGYDIASLKDCNPSSVLFTCFETEHPGASTDDFRNAVHPFAYFEEQITSTRQVAAAYAGGLVFDPSPVCVDLPDAGELLEKSWSPSALDVFFQCPRRFYLTRIVGISEEEEDDPFTVIDAKTLGSLAHTMMQQLAEEHMAEPQFLQLCEAAFDRFLTERPPIHIHDAEKEKADFLKMMQMSYRMDPGNEVLSSETEYAFTHPCGIRLKGFPDRLEKEPDGNLIIADFKTKRRFDHRKDDIDTCLQVVVYAWLCEQAGYPVARCDYRYIRKGRTISCTYDVLRKSQLEEKLQQFKDALTANHFPRNPGKQDENCRYCKLSDICGWDEPTEDTEETEGKENA